MSLHRNILVAIALACFIQVRGEDKLNRSEFKRALHKECQKAYTITCLKLDVVSWVDRLDSNEEYSILPGVSVVREKDENSGRTSELVSELARNFPDDPSARLDTFLLKKMAGYLNNHAIKLKLFDDQDAEEAIGTARRRKKGGYLLALLGAGAMMKSTLGAIALAGLAVLAKKALLTGLLALLISGIIGLKSLVGGKEHTTYEVVSKPVYTSSHTHSVSHEDHGHGHGGWGRSLDSDLPRGLQPDYKPA